MDEQETELVYVMLPVSLGPIDRGELFEDPLDDELQAEQLGYVSGGGTALGEQQPDGSRPIAYCGVDVEAHDLDRTLELLRRKLPELECPPGTQLQYSRDGAELQDEFGGAEWTLAQPRSA
jgi:hypothetical protein